MDRNNVKEINKEIAEIVDKYVAVDELLKCTLE